MSATQTKRLAALRDETALLSSQGLATKEKVDKAFEPLPALGPELIERLGHVLFWRIVLEPYLPQQKGMIARARQVEDANRVLSKVGRVLMVGSMCYRSQTTAGLNLADEPHKPVVGDYILHEMYAGTEVHLESGHTLRLLTDSEVLMAGFDPELIRAYD